MAQVGAGAAETPRLGSGLTEVGKLRLWLSKSTKLSVTEGCHKTLKTDIPSFLQETDKNEKNISDLGDGNSGNPDGHG